MVKQRGRLKRTPARVRSGRDDDVDVDDDEPVKVTSSTSANKKMKKDLTAAAAVIGSSEESDTKPPSEEEEEVSKEEDDDDDSDNDDDVFDVEYIVEERRNGKKNQMEYLIHWLGYGEEDRTWEPSRNIIDPAPLKKWKALQKKKKEQQQMIKLEEEEVESDKDNDNKEETTTMPTTTPNGRRKRKAISYVDSFSSDEDVEEIVETKKKETTTTATTSTKRKKLSKNTNNKQTSLGNFFKKKKPTALDDDDDDFMMDEGSFDDDDDELLVDMDEEEEEDDDDDFASEEAIKPKRKSPAAKKPKVAAKKSTTAAKADPSVKKKRDDFETAEEELEYRLNREPVKPNNNPQKFPKDGPYVDPVGVDPTHGIVEGIVMEQVRKVGGLLKMVSSASTSSKKRPKPLLGELTYPIQLQTACSGTDAPSIALGLIKECLDKIHNTQDDDDDDDDDNKSPHGFDYEHKMSCEIEPFKQAYIGRNFPGVPLFPDITKLTSNDNDDDTAVDVYGRARSVPDGNLFVAGTSCKDFSMLKTTYRLDIEDKGTSGETFLAAVDILEQKQQPMAIFENVDGAPWEKMREYIMGRVKLQDRNVTKDIKSGKKADADNDLKFSINADGRYVAEEIPRQVGIKAGSIVEGFVKGGCDANDVIPLKAKQKNSRGLVKLGELAKTHNINLNKDTLVLEKKARYCTRLCKVDTKNYGLPQTRNRKYLFIWRSDDANDDLGDYFVEILENLKTPLLHSMDAFLLPDTHDRIRCFREALRSGPGLMVSRERAKEKDFWDWNESRNLDTPRHMTYRNANGIDERSRWLTGWGTRGRKTVAPGLWPELVDMWNMRRCDMIDCFAAAAMRDAIPRDALHHSFTWDLSQNVTRAPFRSATVGVSGCVTPGGELLLPHRGRTLMGYEKLLLQGIPFSRLLLGPETEVQLSDLAGNAMSVSVICATMISAICAPQLRRARESQSRALISDFVLGHKYDAANGAVLAQRGDLYGKERNSSGAKDFVKTFTDIAKQLAEDAVRSSVLCTCESSGRVTNDDKILECTGCGMVICHECSGRQQTKSHDLKAIDDGVERPDPHVFERKLRCAVPAILHLGEGWEDAVENCEGLESYSFQLQQVDRKRGHWTLTYGAWEDFGSARQVGEIRVSIGRIGTFGVVGFAAYVRPYAPAIRQEKPQRGTLGDSARLIVATSGETKVQDWAIPKKSKCKRIQIVGSDPCPSQRAQIGLSDKAATDLKAHKPQKQFIPVIKSRNNLIAYHPKWKTWPKTIDISGDDTGRVNGTYVRLGCEQTVVHSALWRREKSENEQDLYIYIRPDTIRTGLDVAMISPTPSYRDNMEIAELVDWIPENALTERTFETDVRFLNWTKSPEKLTLEVPSPKMKIDAPKAFQQKVKENVSDTSGPILCQINGMPKEIVQSLLEFNTSGDMDLLGRLGTRNAKRLSIVAAPWLLKYAAEDKLPLELSKWYQLSQSSKPFGFCGVNVPPRPLEQWKEITGRKVNIERVYDAEESNEYYLKLEQRPTVFQVNVDKRVGVLTVRMNPSVAAHRAAAPLVRGRAVDDGYAKSVKVDYCLSELSSMGEPDTKEFHVPNSDTYEETNVEGLELPLYMRQAKALTRMQAIERGEVLFSEEERSEHILPGIGWCLIARAAKKSPLRGGVLGDAIGSGKTVVTIALILAGAKDARANRDVANGKSSATLIVVPPGLVQQWDDERRKFTKNKLKCITVDCTEALKRRSVKELCEADIVIVPASIMEERPKSGKARPYTENLSKKAGSTKIPPAPSGYSQREAPTIEGTWVRNMASGPDIYVGNKGKQKNRDEQAYYGHCYSEAVMKLRNKNFKATERGVPLEYFTWERIIVDECHETLVTGKGQETDAADFKKSARMGAREFLGVAQTDITKRALVATTGVWGLTGTPLLETEARVTELANLMGGTYLTGGAHHWRKEERESGRDIFLNQQEGTKSREYRCAIQAACHSYVKEACQRNRGAKLQVSLTREQKYVNMSPTEAQKFQNEVAFIQSKSFAINVDQLGDKASHVLSITASSKARHAALLEKIESIQQDEPDTKIIIFASTYYGGYESALSALDDASKSGTHRFCHICDNDSVHRQNEVISWFRHVDATAEDRLRPRVLLLSFEQAAGHNLQEACHHVILFDPMYSGTDAVADASVEEQAVGRVMRQGQKFDVTVTRIMVKGPKGERCLDDWIVERNLDEDVLRAATSNFD